MKLKTPSAPFSPVFVAGESITIDCEGKVLVLPTGHPYLLPKYNEYVLNSDRALQYGSTVFTDDLNNDTGLKYLASPYILLCDPDSDNVDFFYFTDIPKRIQIDVTELIDNGIVFQTSDERILYTSDNNQLLVAMSKGAYVTKITFSNTNGLIYHGKITFSNPLVPSYAEGYFSYPYFSSPYFSSSFYPYSTSEVPLFLSPSHPGSITKFLQPYGCTGEPRGLVQFCASDYEFSTSSGKYLFVRKYI